jgi:hypothetical protein
LINRYSRDLTSQLYLRTWPRSLRISSFVSCARPRTDFSATLKSGHVSRSRHLSTLLSSTRSDSQSRETYTLYPSSSSSQRLRLAVRTMPSSLEVAHIYVYRAACCSHHIHKKNCRWEPLVSVLAVQFDCITILYSRLDHVNACHGELCMGCFYFPSLLSNYLMCSSRK